MVETLRDLVEADKLIADPADWTRRDRRLDLKLPLEIDGLVEEGLFLRGCVLETRPDQEVVFQLEYHGLSIPGGTGPLCRIEWNPLRRHNNRGKGPRELRFIEQPGSHIHLFADNWSEANGALLRDNLPVARPITEPIQSFTECLEFVGNQFRINNISVVKTPEWVLSLEW
jgi:hypothetical protein